MSDLFLLATRYNYRYATVRGYITTEDLWELPLLASNNSGFDLNSVAKTINDELQSLTEESFVSLDADSPERELLTSKLELVKTIIAIRQKEIKEANDRAARAALTHKLQTAIQAKRDEQLNATPLEELEAQLAALNS